jgi:hypothetical protein
VVGPQGGDATTEKVEAACLSASEAEDSAEVLGRIVNQILVSNSYVRDSDQAQGICQAVVQAVSDGRGDGSVLREERRGTHGGAILDALLGRVGDPTTVADEMDDANVDVSRTAQQQRVRGDLRRIDDNVGPETSRMA